MRWIKYVCSLWAVFNISLCILMTRVNLVYGCLSGKMCSHSFCCSPSFIRLEKTLIVCLRKQRTYEHCTLHPIQHLPTQALMPNYTVIFIRNTYVQLHVDDRMKQDIHTRAVASTTMARRKNFNLMPIKIEEGTTTKSDRVDKRITTDYWAMRMSRNKHKEMISNSGKCARHWTSW